MEGAEVGPLVVHVVVLDLGEELDGHDAVQELQQEQDGGHVQQLGDTAVVNIR